MGDLFTKNLKFRQPSAKYLEKNQKLRKNRKFGWKYPLPSPTKLPGWSENLPDKGKGLSTL